MLESIFVIAIAIAMMVKVVNVVNTLNDHRIDDVAYSRR